MIDHDEANEMLALMALHAVDGDEMVMVDAHVATCSRCQHDLDVNLEVAAALGNSVEPLPEGLWSNISSRLGDRRATTMEGAPALLVGAGATVVSLDERRSARERRTKRIFSSVSALAAAAIILLGVGFANASHHANNLQIALNVANRTDVQRALATPGYRVVNLASTGNQRVAQFVMLPSGTGYLVSTSLPKLRSNETYQLWGIVAGSAVSVGVMGRAPHDVTFTMASSPSPTALSVTVEPSGGSLLPSNTLVATGTV